MTNNLNNLQNCLNKNKHLKKKKYFNIYLN